ncbi:hypothetical protein Tco_0989230 [Tanacetum coccineum]|uniref:Uncharacterized protein n=1 Tax=Tanacetum coccineum TaxID=301880 RepID=A0ABQ5ET39_9ASTR
MILQTFSTILHSPVRVILDVVMLGTISTMGLDCPPRVPLVLSRNRVLTIKTLVVKFFIHNIHEFSTTISYVVKIVRGSLMRIFSVHNEDRNSSVPNLAIITTLPGCVFQPPQYSFCHSIDHQPPKEMSARELLLQEKLHKALQAVCEKLNQQEQAANVSTHTPEPSRRFNFICYDDDDDEESTIPLNEIIS